MQKPKASWVPASGKPTAKYPRGKLGEPLPLQFTEFDLTDCNLKQSCGDYNCFHDPMLKNFFRQSEKKKQLLKHGLVTEDDKVLCSLKEFNEYTKYIKSVQQNWNKLLLKEQKQLLKESMLRQMEGKIPETVSFGHMRESLISQSKRSFRALFRKVLRPGETLHDAELEWERTQRLQLEGLKKELIGELRAEGRLYRVPVGASKLGAAVSAHRSTRAPASAPKGPAFPNTAEQIASEKKKEEGGRAMIMKDLQHFEHKPAIEADSPYSKIAMKLVSSVLRKIQESPSSDFSLSETSSDEISEVQSFSGSSMTSPSSLDSEAQIVSPTSEVAEDLVRDVLRKIQDSPSSDLTSMDLMFSYSLLVSPTSSPTRSCLYAQVVSPTSEVAEDLVRDVLRKIQRSPSSDCNLQEIQSKEPSELQSYFELKGTVESQNPLIYLLQKKRKSSPASYESSKLTLTDLEMFSYSLRESPTSSPTSLGSDTWVISSASEVAEDLVKGVLRNIRELPNSDCEPRSIQSSELQNFSESGRLQSSPASIVSSDDTLMDLETLSDVTSDSDAQLVSPSSEAAMNLVSDIMRRLEESPCSDFSRLDSPPASKSGSAGKKKKSKARKPVFTFLNRSWESMLQIFTNARHSNRIHIL